MNISLNPEAQRLLEEQMKQGGHPTPEDTVMAGLLALQQRRDEALSAEEIAELQDEIFVGAEQADRGEFVEFSAEDVIAERRAALAARKKVP